MGTICAELPETWEKGHGQICEGAYPLRTRGQGIGGIEVGDLGLGWLKERIAANMILRSEGRWKDFQTHIKILTTRSFAPRSHRDICECCRQRDSR